MTTLAGQQGFAPVAIRALGGFRVFRKGRPVPPCAWQSKKARDLLKLLVVRRDIETFVEIVEADTKDGPVLADVQAAATTCDLALDPATAPLTCSDEVLPVPTVSNPPIDGCIRADAPFDPIELNTVVVGEFVKTIKVAKELLDCDAEQEADLVDPYVFTERVEQRDDVKGARPNFDTVSTRFEGVACVKDLLQGRIDRCFRFRPDS